MKKMDRKKNDKTIRSAVSTASSRAERISAHIAGIGLTVILTVLPVILYDGYYDILDVKYTVILVTGAAMAVLMLIANAGRISAFFSGNSRGRQTSAVSQARKGKGSTADTADASLRGGTLVSSIKAFWKKLSLTDKGVFVFWIISVVSTLQAYPYISQAIYGNEGRYNGLILNTVYMVFYFIVTRNLRYKPRYLGAFLCAGMIVCTLGITDFFKLNLLGLVAEGDTTFMSTIGNINSYTVFCGLMIAVSGGLFIFGDCRWYVRVLLLMVYAFCQEAMLMGNSDNTFLFLGAFFAIAPFEAFKKKQSLCRYAVTASTFLTCILALLLISAHYKGETIPVDSILKLIEGNGIIKLVVIAAWAVTAIIYYATGRIRDIKHTSEGQSNDDPMPKSIVRIWGICIGICVTAVAVVLIWANANAEMVMKNWPELAGYLVFNDDWGTSRGYIWRAAFEEYACLAPIHQIFGTGPDTFGIYMVTLRYSDMVNATTFFYDSAHNEYIELLFTLGPIGLAAHLAILAGTVKRCFAGAGKRLGRYRGSAMAAALAVMGYAAQAFININVPVVAPCFWALLTVGESIARSAEEVR